MDKHRTERISIRINGKEKYFLSDEELNQEISAAKEMEENQLEVERMSLEPIFDEEMVEEADSFKGNVIDFGQRLEVKRNGNKRRYEKVFKGSKMFSSEKKHTYMLNKKKKRPPILIGNNPQNALIKKLIFVLLSAIVIGIGFGYVLLSIFTDISEEQTAGSNTYNGENGQASALGNNSGGAGAGGGQAAGTNGAAAINSIASLKLEVIQGGAFGSEESANQFADNLKDRGAAAVVLPKSNPVLMFIGLGTNRDELESLGQYYLDLGQEIYIKSFNLSEIDGAKVGNPKVTEYVSTGLNIYQSVIQLSAQSFQQNRLEKSAVDSIGTSLSNWNKSKPTELPTALEQFSGSLSKANQALASYQIKPDQQQLWNAQQALLEGLLAYKNWHDEKVAQ